MYSRGTIVVDVLKMAADDQRRVAREHSLARRATRHAFPNSVSLIVDDFKKGKISDFPCIWSNSYFLFFSHFCRVDPI